MQRSCECRFLYMLYSETPWLMSKISGFEGENIYISGSSHQGLAGLSTYYFRKEISVGGLKESLSPIFIFSTSMQCSF